MIRMDWMNIKSIFVSIVYNVISGIYQGYANRKNKTQPPVLQNNEKTI